MNTVTSTEKIGNGVLKDFARSARVKEKMHWVSKKQWLSGNHCCKHCRYGQMQGAQIVCALLCIKTLRNAQCHEFSPGALRIYQEAL